MSQEHSVRQLTARMQMNGRSLGDASLAKHSLRFYSRLYRGLASRAVQLIQSVVTRLWWSAVQYATGRTCRTCCSLRRARYLRIKRRTVLLLPARIYLHTLRSTHSHSTAAAARGGIWMKRGSSSFV